MSFQIAIDGPLASGKGTVARLVAERLHLLYIDTGAMYRMTALQALRHQVDLNDEHAVVNILQTADMQMRPPRDAEKDGRLSTVLLNGEDVSWQIRTEQVSDGSSKVAVHAHVREFLVKKQQAIAANQDVIMEGRDITYRVLPHANLKIYLTASTEVRAQRRLEDLQRRGVDTQYEHVLADVVMRDKRDMEREADPLQVVEDAWVLDTTQMTIEEAVEAIVARAEQLKGK